MFGNSLGPKHRGSLHFLLKGQRTPFAFAACRGVSRPGLLQGAARPSGTRGAAGYRRVNDRDPRATRRRSPCLRRRLRATHARTPTAREAWARVHAACSLSRRTAKQPHRGICLRPLSASRARRAHADVACRLDRGRCVSAPPAQPLRPFRRRLTRDRRASPRRAEFQRWKGGDAGAAASRESGAAASSSSQGSPESLGDDSLLMPLPFQRSPPLRPGSDMDLMLSQIVKFESGDVGRNSYARRWASASHSDIMGDRVF